jgi:hypothetical protein
MRTDNYGDADRRILQLPVTKALAWSESKPLWRREMHQKDTTSDVQTAVPIQSVCRVSVRYAPY